MNSTKYFTVVAALLLATSAHSQTTTTIADYGDGTTVTAREIAPGIIKVTHTPLSRHGVERPVITTAPLSEPSTDAVLPVATIHSDGKTLTMKSNAKTSTVTDKGIKTLPVGADGVQRYTLTLSTVHGASLYGAGERGHSLNLANDTLIMYNKQNYGYTGDERRIAQMNISMPLLVSSNGYALLFDDYGTATMTTGADITYTFEDARPISYYYVTGKDASLASVTTALTSLTGRQELPPLWTLGYISSRYGYHTDDELSGVVDSLQTAGYPLDGVVLDLYWYGREQDMGRLAWDKQQWPDPDDMLTFLKKKHINVVTIAQPYVLRNGRGVDNYNFLAPKGMLVMNKDTVSRPLDVTIWVGQGGMFDVSNPETRQWLAERYGSLSERGVSAWWGDLGEPEVHPEKGLHANGLLTRQYHNLYGNDWSEIVYDMHKAKFPNTRMMTMMRGGTTGLQRFNVFPWSTDVSRTWGGLEPQIRIMLNSGLSGLGYMGHDVGGFAIVDPENTTDDELYVRWMQLGVFSPMLRTHAQYKAEPYNYPKYKSLLLALAKERYRWIPYNYTLAWENATKGWPLVRPLDFHDATASGRYDNISDQYLWGRDIMVAPVMTKGTTQRPIIFPEGSNWVDINNPANTYKGGSIINYDAPIDCTPVFAREGSFIVTADYPMKSTAQYRNSRYHIDYYPAEDTQTSSTIFEDDMTTPTTQGHNQGRTITMTGNDTGKQIDVTLCAQGDYAGAKDVKTLTMVFNGLKKQPRYIEADGRSLRIVYDKERGTATVAFAWHVERPIYIILKK